MKSNRIVIILLAAMTALILSSCYRTPEQRADYTVKHLATELKLDDSQKAKLDKIKEEFLAKRPGMIKMREETIKEANELMRSAEIDKTRLNALAEKNQMQVNDAIQFIVAKFTEIHDMLTPEQREKLVVMTEKHMKDKRHTGKEQEKGGTSY